MNPLLAGSSYKHRLSGFCQRKRTGQQPATDLYGQSYIGVHWKRMCDQLSEMAFRSRWDGLVAVDQPILYQSIETTLTIHVVFFLPVSSRASNTSVSAGSASADALESPFLKGLKMIAIIFAVFVLPFLIGRFIAKRIKMPNHATSMGIVLATIIGCVIVITTNDLRYGIDIVGGTDLVYELDRTTRQDSIASGMEVTAKDLVKPLGERLKPAGTKELVIRPSGNDKIEIIVPAVEQMEVEEIKRMISQAGILEFRIVANSSDHQDIMTLARKQADNPEAFQRMSREVVNDKGQVVAVWRTIGREDEVRNGARALRSPIYSSHLARDASTGRLLPPYSGSNETNGFERWLQRQGIEDVELLWRSSEMGSLPRGNRFRYRECSSWYKLKRRL